MKLLNIKQQLTTAYHPQCNGLTERFNGIFTRILNRYLDKAQKDWDTLLPHAVKAYNTSTNETTHFSPYRLFYGRDETDEGDLTFKIDDLNEEYSKAVKKNIELIRNMALENTEKAQEKIKQYYNKQHRNVQYKVDDWVLLYRPVVDVGKATKFTPKYIGPFRIIKVLSALNYVIKDELGVTENTCTNGTHIESKTLLFKKGRKWKLDQAIKTRRGGMRRRKQQ